jgi:hypothetical protein
MAAILALLALPSACADDDGLPPEPDPPVDPVTPQTCEWGEVPGGACLVVGVPEELCAEGFVPDERGGCRAILPDLPCPPGQIAVPGDATCRALEGCGEAIYGEIAVEPDTEYVDGAYAGGDSDGTIARPWTTIADGIEAAEPTAIVAIAAGTYVEHVWSGGKSVRIWGRCPDLVTIQGPEPGVPVVQLSEGGAPALRGVAVTGGSIGVFSSAVESATVEGVRVWGSPYGIGAAPQLGPTSLIVSNALVEQIAHSGILVEGSPAIVRRTSIRHTGATSNEPRAIHAQLGAEIDVEQSLFESNQTLAVNALASRVTLTGTVVRDTLPESPDGRGGVSMGLYPGPGGERSSGALIGSLIEGFPEFGAFAQGSDLEVRHTTFRAPRPGPATGVGVGVALGSTLTLEASLFDENRDSSLLIQESTATVTAALARDAGGFGALIRHGASAEIRQSRFDSMAAAGIYVLGATATLEDLLVVGTLPDPMTGQYGDGIVVGVGLDDGLPGAATISRVAVEASARAGITNFGSFVSLAEVSLACNPIALDGETGAGLDFAFEEAGEVACGCAPEVETCLVQSSMLAPPDVGEL